MNTPSAGCCEQAGLDGGVAKRAAAAFVVGGIGVLVFAQQVEVERGSAGKGAGEAALAGRLRPQVCQRHLPQRRENGSAHHRPARRPHQPGTLLFKEPQIPISRLLFGPLDSNPFFLQVRP